MSARRNARNAAFAEAAPVFAALGAATRLSVVSKLCTDGPTSTAGLSHGTGVTRQAITKHLDTLEAAGVVRSNRSGRERIWELETARLQKARRCLDEIGEQWDAAIERLRLFVEEPS
jgi:DNA-binding transcriptional ArsR family regulator